ncbi:MAG: FdhF/YdeP family oxidoreductase [Lunatimonas sp.]|uniref:FdhF/YdeP family oxidoreductase n=1 Tax=Lunatimonas sp. TaxID=2060141 RepID=UPI00263AFD18|nr:FdhF/YdeP family oxidoreductase [Lunatimonas sp.]MCC5939309.1 FdhF/YdeP family oxidoreductase [Lunatimonas sp.]
MSKAKPSKDPKARTLPNSAAGFPSISSVAYRIWEETYVGRGVKTLFKLNQPKGFDCPSCAWPDPNPEDVSSVAEYCENGAKAVAWEITKNRVDRAFFKRHSVRELLAINDHWLEKQGRLTEPMILRPGSDYYEAVSWETAFSEIATHLHNLENPDQSIWYTSGRTSNEAAFLYQTFVRMLGTNNLPDCSNMCHEASGVALKQTLGIGKASVTLEDIRQTEVLMILGQNPGTNAPRMLTELQKLKQAGGKIIAVNPLPEAGLMGFRHPQKPWEWIGEATQLQDIYLPVGINGDLALLKALQKILWEAEKKQPGEIFDQTFIQSHTSGYKQLVDHLDTLSLGDLILASGLPEQAIRDTAELMMHSKRIIIAWAMGITQQRNAESTIREIVNLLLLKGAMGKPGAGTLPVRGHSNVQGDRTMGIWEKMPEPFMAKLGAAFSFHPPQKEGFGTVQSIQAMLDGQAKVFFGMGGNFALATPDTERVVEALQSCELTVHVSTKLNRSHLIHGKTALILPCLGRTEEDHTAHGRQFVSTEDTAGRVRMSMGDLPAASPQLKSEVAIVCGLARATLGAQHPTPWEDYAANYDLIRDKIEAVIPGFEQYNQRVRQPGGFFLPNGARDRNFQTPDGKAHFTVNEWLPPSIPSDRFILMTLRSHDQFNTTIYGNDDRYRGIRDSREIVMMHPDDMKRKGLKAMEKTRITSYFQGELRHLEGFAAIPYDIPAGSAAMYFPEGNVLVALNSHSPESHCPASKYIEVRIEKLAP